MSLGLQVPSKNLLGWVWRVQIPSEEVLGGVECVITWWISKPASLVKRGVRPTGGFGERWSDGIPPLCGCQNS